MGLVGQVMTDATLAPLKGFCGIGHCRYATAGASSLIQAQPFSLRTLHGSIAVAHNGQLVNADSLRHRMMLHGVGMVSSSDSELIAQILCAPPPPPSTEHVHGLDIAARLRSLMSMSLTSYSSEFRCPAPLPPWPCESGA